MINLPIVITFSRIFLIPLFIVAVYRNPFLGTVIFVLASATDVLDGYIARKSQQITKFGVLLDPIADKLLVISALIVLVDTGLVDAWIAIVIIAREFIVTGLRIVALTMNIVIPAETGGKVKMVTQFAAICLLLLSRVPIDIDLYAPGTVLLWAALIIGLISGTRYFIQFWRRMV